MSTGCVVCGRGIDGDPVYANAWERARKRMPCCSPTCAAAFDPDHHWIPAVLPTVVAGDEQARLRTLARQRLQGLDLASPVVRELLAAGLAPTILRALVAESRGASAEARSRNRHGFIASLFGRRIHPQDPDARGDRTYAGADADLDRWEAEVARRGRG